jgi:hypothetical protein
MPFIVDPGRVPGTEELAAVSDALRPLPVRFLGAQDQMLMFSVDAIFWEEAGADAAADQLIDRIIEKLRAAAKADSHGPVHQLLMHNNRIGLT